MSAASSFVVFVLIWWAVFFMVLPWGVKSQQETGAVVPGSEPGAPDQTRLPLKLAVTTGISVVVWGIAFLVTKYDLLGLAKVTVPGSM